MFSDSSFILSMFSLVIYTIGTKEMCQGYHENLDTSLFCSTFLAFTYALWVIPSELVEDASETLWWCLNFFHIKKGHFVWLTWDKTWEKERPGGLHVGLIISRVIWSEWKLTKNNHVTLDLISLANYEVDQDAPFLTTIDIYIAPQKWSV